MFIGGCSIFPRIFLRSSEGGEGGIEQGVVCGGENDRTTITFQYYLVQPFIL